MSRFHHIPQVYTKTLKASSFGIRTQIVRSSNIHCRVHQSPPLVPPLNQMDPVHTTPCYLRLLLMLSTHLHFCIIRTLCQKNEGSVEVKQRSIKMDIRTIYRTFSPERTPSYQRSTRHSINKNFRKIVR
jgi:hypothetical protein